MENKSKTEPGSCSIDEMKLENMSIHDLVSFLRTSFRTEQFDSVEEILVSRDKKHRTEIQHLQEKLEMERQARLQTEEDLKKSEELCERGKMAQNNYEKLLMEVKKNNLGERESIVELKMKNNELELEVCELRKMKEKWVDDSNAVDELRMRVGVLENEKNAFRVKNSELEKSMKKISEVLANAGNGITDFQEKEIVESVPSQRIEPPMKRSKGDQGASSSVYIKMGGQSKTTDLFASPPVVRNTTTMLPPSTTGRKKRSAVWNDYTLEPNSKKIAICNYCSKNLKYYGTTSSMAAHSKSCKNNPKNESNKR